MQEKHFVTKLFSIAVGDFGGKSLFGFSSYKKEPVFKQF